ncbi:MAG: recombinase family protein [Pseudonocardiaceae bacterium]
MGDTIARLVHLLPERGGIWLAKHTTATLTWTVSSTGPTGDDGAVTSTPPWVRLDATFTGAWSGRFSLAASAPRLAANLWCVAASPLVGILPEEAVDKALPPTGAPHQLPGSRSPKPWTTRFTAKVLNDRGHRTSSGGKWSGYQVIRALNNRVYLGELTFRETTVTDTHAPIIDLTVWEQAQAILDARGESHAHRAASGSDYVLTGRLRCPQCSKAMIGTRATGRSLTYRYYTCWNLARYDATKCDFKRLNADAVDAAVLDALTSFYRTRHDLIADAIAHEQKQHRAAHADRHAELAAVDNEITKTGQAIDRYLTAFERGTMDEELVADRLTRTRQDQAPSHPPRRTHPSPRRRAHRPGARYPGRGGRPHRRDHHQRHPQPDQGTRGSPRRQGHHHRTRPTHPGLPHPPTPQQRRGRNRPTSGNGPERSGSHND